MSDLKSTMNEVRQDMIDFEQKLIRIPSLTGHEEEACRLVLAKMQELGFEDAKIDSYGNVMGRMGNGPKQILFDAHLDVVGFSWTGKKIVLHTLLPAWEEPVDSRLTQVGIHAYENMFGRKPELCKWSFATNGFACAGRYHVPTIGFGPGDYLLAHQKNEHCRLEDIVNAALFYAELVKEL